jgi:exonuclease SbcD
MGLKLLAVGDMHLGRQPSRLPQTLTSEARDLGPAGAWERLVEVAIDEQVHVVALAGDVVERDEDFFEAYRDLSQGIDRLTDAGITVVGIAGNHDVHVLPRLAKQLPNFHLLGSNGTWEAFPIDAAGEQLTIHGWSFQQKQVTRSPLQGQQFTRNPGANIGLLHCDRDNAASVYAPVMSEELANTGLDAWLLGHIHKPDALSINTPSGYLGCLTGVDAGEAGHRGPWLYTIQGGQISSIEQWLFSPLWWQPIDLDLTDLDTVETARDRLLDNLRAFDQNMLASMTDSLNTAANGATNRPPRAIAIRLRLTGHTQLGQQVEQLFNNEGYETLHMGEAQTSYHIERCINTTRASIALDVLAQRTDPAGLLARRLLDLETPSTERARALIAGGRTKLEDIRGASRWSQLEQEVLTDNDVIEWLSEAGHQLLLTMLAQQEQSHQ